jgi:hypothetical protein
MATSTAAQNPFDPQPKTVTNPGIIGGAITNVTQGANASNVAAPSQYNPVSGLNIQQYTAQERNVDKATETAAGQLDSILTQDSPLMRRARTIASQNMNQRGLVNSSMAQGAGVAAMIDRATPIAQQDAETYSNRALANMNAVNTANQFNVGQNNSLFSQGLGIAADYAKQIQSQQFQTSERTAAQDFTAAQAALERAQQNALADKSIAAQQALQKAQQDFDAAQAKLNREQQTSERIASQTFQAGESALERTQQTNLQKAQQDFTAAENALTRAQEVVLQDKSIKAQQDLQKAQQDFTAAQAVLDREQQTSLQESQQSFTATQNALQIQAQKDLQTSQQSFQAAQNALDRATQELLTQKNIDAQANLQKAAQTFQESQAKLDRDLQKTLQTAQQAFVAAESALDRANQVALADKSITAQQALQKAQQDFTAAQAALDRTAAETAQQRTINAQNALATAQQAFAASQAVLDRDAATRMTELQNNMNRSNASDALKANVALSTLNAVSQVALDGNLDSAAKNAAITNITNASNATLGYASTLYQTTTTNSGSSSTSTSSGSTADVVTKPVDQSPAETVVKPGGGGIINNAVQEPPPSDPGVSPAKSYAAANNMSDDQFYGNINDFLATNPSAAEIEAAKTQYGVSDADIAEARRRSGGYQMVVDEQGVRSYSPRGDSGVSQGG